MRGGGDQNQFRTSGKPGGSQSRTVEQPGAATGSGGRLAPRVVAPTFSSSPGATEGMRAEEVTSRFPSKSSALNHSSNRLTQCTRIVGFPALMAVESGHKSGVVEHG